MIVVIGKNTMSTSNMERLFCVELASDFGSFYSIVLGNIHVAYPNRIFLKKVIVIGFAHQFNILKSFCLLLISQLMATILWLLNKLE